jgi:protein-disulfide isomerase
VLEKETAKRKIPLKQLIQEATSTKGIQVSDEEVNRYPLENGYRLKDWSGSMGDLRNRIKASIEQRKAKEKVSEFVQSPTEQYGVTIYLKEPRPLHVEVDVLDDLALGPADAPVKIVEFSDYQCPVCRQNHEVVRKVRDSYMGRIQWIFKDHPLKMHRYAEKAAEAARCAADQGKFWQYQDALFAEEGELTSSRLQELAVSVTFTSAPCASNVCTFSVSLFEAPSINELAAAGPPVARTNTAATSKRRLSLHIIRAEIGES